MKLIREIVLEDIPQTVTLVPRLAARAVVVDEQGRIPLLYVSRDEYYKLPGGGVDEGEDIFEALFRECLEEIGCEISVEGYLGSTVEKRTEHALLQTSHCYHGRALVKGTPSFRQKEVDEGFQIVWVPAEDALSLIHSSQPKNYSGPFIVARDKVFIEAYLDRKKNKQVE